MAAVSISEDWTFSELFNSKSTNHHSSVTEFVSCLSLLKSRKLVMHAGIIIHMFCCHWADYKRVIGHVYKPTWLCPKKHTNRVQPNCTPTKSPQGTVQQHVALDTNSPRPAGALRKAYRRYFPIMSNDFFFLPYTVKLHIHIIWYGLSAWNKSEVWSVKCVRLQVSHFRPYFAKCTRKSS